MKRPHKMKLLDEVASNLKADGKEVSNDSVLRSCMGSVYAGKYEAGSLGKITPSDVARYFREFYVAN